MKQALRSLRNNFIVGFVAILPLALSVYIFVWLVEFVLGLTDNLLRFLPADAQEIVWKVDPVTNTRTPAWPFRVLSFLISIALVTLLGFIARNVIGKSLLQAIDNLALRVPFLNKIYGAIKEVIDAFGASKKGIFQRVVLVRFPYRESFSIGFVTAEQPGEANQKTGEEIINVFVATTPNPTSGYLLLVPKRETIAMDMSVTDAVKMVISGGAVVPAPSPAPPRSSTPAPAPDGNP